MLPRFAASALLACLLLAGCSGDAAGEKATSKLAGKTESRIVDPDAEVSGANGTADGGRARSAPGLGEIRGKVFDDALLPVKDATVSLLGTEFSVTTKKDGSFEFLNLTPGDYVVRVVSDYYRVHEGGVAVRADRVTLATVTLVPNDDRGPGYRPHLHDYWGTNAEILLLDLRLDWGTQGSYGKYPVAGPIYNGAYASNQAGIWIPFTIPERDDGLPALVLPGTKALKVTFSWDEDDVDVDGFKLRYASAASAVQVVVPKAFANGVEATVELDGKDPDNGHQIFSLWTFGAQPTARTPPTNSILGPVQVKIVMVKGELPVDVPHEDFWGSNQTYQSRALTSPVTTLGVASETYITAYMDYKRLVPPGTQMLKVRLEFSSNKHQAADFDWTLAFKPSNIPRAAPASDYRLLTAKETGDRFRLFEVPLLASETDAFYQKTSNAAFQVRQAGNDYPYGLGEYDHTFRLEVISVKDPNFL